MGRPQLLTSNRRRLPVFRSHSKSTSLYRHIHKNHSSVRHTWATCWCSWLGALSRWQRDCFTTRDQAYTRICNVFRWSSYRCSVRTGSLTSKGCTYPIWKFTRSSPSAIAKKSIHASLDDTFCALNSSGDYIYRIFRSITWFAQTYLGWLQLE